MKKSDFKLGQTVYLKAINDNARNLKDGEVKIDKAIVTKVGNKYITISRGKWDNGIQFDYTNEFFEKVNIGSPDYLLLLDPKQLDEEKQAEAFIKKIRSVFYGFDYNKCDLSLDKLMDICVIIDN